MVRRLGGRGGASRAGAGLGLLERRLGMDRGGAGGEGTCRKRTATRRDRTQTVQALRGRGSESANDPGDRFRCAQDSQRAVVPRRFRPEDAALILPVLRVMLEWAKDEWEGDYLPTKDQAERIVRFRRIVPDIPLLEVGQRALSSSAGAYLETYFAWAPWRSPEDAAAYTEALGAG